MKTKTIDMTRIEYATAAVAKANEEQFDAVAAARALGATWDEIAEALGVARQSAHGKFAERCKRVGALPPVW